ncbi:MAG: hypothetical protein ACW98X_24025 [Promethearchaeota archaeon]|jgi:uncharacterized protein YeeX (DUF496 family)
MSFPPPPQNSDDDFSKWYYYIESQKAIQKELNSINKGLAKLDKRVAILEEYNDRNDSDKLTKTIEHLIEQMKSQKKTISPRSTKSWIESADWMKIAKAVAFFIIAIASFAAGIGFVFKFFK